MIKNLVFHEELLSKHCEPVDLDESVLLPEAQDLLDTALHHKHHNRVGCLGLAANQINIFKRFFAVLIDDKFIIMVNPVIIPNKAAGVIGGVEGCLSRPGQGTIWTKRFVKIRVQYNEVFKGEIILKKRKEITVKKLTARVVQHEVDHLNGVLI
ncbi:MAG: peptide deformylase [Candidatus Marinimicrobia bacterium]|nr:peptide deformylase [Candidatus Neomarinimicrobiota bacterium]